MAAGARDVPFDRRHAIIFASEGGHPEVLTYLLDKAGSCINCRNFLGQTPLHMSCARGNIEITQILLNAKARVDIADINGRTVLHEVARCRVFDTTSIVKQLLDAGSPVNHSDVTGEIPLYLAARLGNMNTMRLLLDTGSKIKVTNGNGDSILDDLLKTYSGLPHYLLNLLFASGCPITDMENSNDDDNYGELMRLIENDRKPIQELSGLCRRFLRKHLMSPEGGQHCNLLVAVKGLPLPMAIKDFLLYGLMREDSKPEVLEK